MRPGWLILTLDIIQVVIFFYFVTLNLLYLVLMALSLAWCHRYKRRSVVHPINTESLEGLKRLVPPVAIVIAAYNEERVIVQSVRSLLGVSYPRVGIIVVNDGSTDHTLEELTRS